MKHETTIGVMVDGKPMIAKIRTRQDWDGFRKLGSKPRVYVEGPGVTPAWDFPEYSSNTSENDKAWRRYSREEKRLMKQVIAALGIEATYNPNAGCSSCPCSPGFIVDRGASFGFTSWVVVEPLKF